MKYLFTKQGVAVIDQIASARVLLAFDFDGTLAPIVGDRNTARMTKTTRQLFARVCERYPCAVISGRGDADVRARLEDAAVRYVVGNHGIAPAAFRPAFRRDIARADAALRESLGDVGGVDIENKVWSLAVHYGRARQRKKAEDRILRAAQALPVAVRIGRGINVVNLVSARAPHKGDALLTVRAAEGADIAFFIGDDVTDEDVFALDQPGRLVTVRVGRSTSSAASYFLKRQGEMDRLLLQLLTARREWESR